jgi:tetratricopeptide (TPR) repeat protein
MFALLTVGNLYPMDQFYTEAAKTFQQALDLQPGQQKTRALLNFYIARAVSRSGALADLEQAIDHYTQALALNPRLYDALYNRGTVWLHRSYLLEAGSDEITRSLDAAIADLTQTVAARTWYADAWLNRGIAYYERNAQEDQRAAIEDFNRVIELQRRDHRGYYHRALARIRAGGTEDWTGDLTQVLEMRPNDASAYNAFCWGYALAQQPELALPNCDRAVELDPTGASHDGRGITLSQLGRYEEAIVELEAYLAWIRPLKPASLFRRLRGPQMEQWIRMLKREQNPFDQTTLNTLR